VLSCEIFGVKQGPGCLQKIIQTYASPSTPAARRPASAKALKPLLGYLLSK
jgi:hypothetical protein